MKNIEECRISKMSPHEWLISLPIIWIFSGQLITSDSYKAMIALSLISLITSIWQYGYQIIIHNIITNKWIQVIGIMLISTIFYKEYNSSVSNSSLRSYAIMLVLLVSLPKVLSYKIFSHLHWLLLTSSFIMLSYTTLNMYYWENPRSLWDINPIPYTTISAAIAISSICYLLTSEIKNTRTVAITSFIFSFNSLVTGLSRGPFLALFISLFIVVIFTYRKQNIKHIRLVTVIVAMLLSVSIHSNLVTERVKNTENAISTIQQGGTDTSIGARIKLWSSSIYLIFENPILGLGNKEKLYREELANNGIIEQETVQWGHYHNQYVNTLVKQGFIGLALLILLVGYPLLRIKVLDTLPASIILGVLSVFWVSALTDIPLNHAQPLIIFIALIYLCWVQSKEE
ncbi:O-antigen ligase family protein [Vibrio vulnificus]|uniref:O-antigen ligase family protein n=1 Tax=Vibrio vulnificus TaxID=672 RepID=UPI003D9CB5B9